MHSQLIDKHTCLWSQVQTVGNSFANFLSSPRGAQWLIFQKTIQTLKNKRQKLALTKKLLQKVLRLHP